MDSVLASKKIDFIYLFLPSIISIILVSLLEINSVSYLILAAIAFYILDAGHVYTTFLRMRAQTKNDKLKILVPIISFGFVFYIALYFNLPYVWATVIYATFIHNVKQNYGIAIWHRKVNKLKTQSNFKNLFYFTNILCFITLHTRTDLVVTKGYPYSSLLLIPHQSIYNVLISIYILSMFILFYNCIRGHFNQIKATFLPIIMALTYGYCFLIAKTFEQAMIPLVISHGLSYSALINHSQKKIFNKTSFIILLFLLILGGSYEYFVTDILYKLNLNIHLGVFLQSVALSFLFSHYYYDSYLWKNTNNDMKLILS